MPLLVKYKQLLVIQHFRYMHVSYLVAPQVSVITETEMVLKKSLS